jgi:cyclophilin family peptidyl-prolyl cis-trans isomerase
MKRFDIARSALLLLTLGLTACGGPIVHNLVPLPGMEDEAPEITEIATILMTTTAGDITIAVYPEAAPNGAARFVELVEAGYYDNTPVSRVVDGFVAQFGVNWRAPHNAWRERTIRDDPPLFALGRGTLAFAKTSAPNSASTQVFINFGDNNRLAVPPNSFTTFGEVVEGMEIVDGFARVGDPSGGLDQARLWANGDTYLASLPAQPTMIISARVR